MVGMPFDRSYAEAEFAEIVRGWNRHRSASGTRFDAPGIESYIDRQGRYEGATRMLWALGGWFQRPGRPDVLDGIDLRSTAIELLENGPADWDSIPKPHALDQRIVEAATVAWAATRFPTARSESLERFLARFGEAPGKELLRERRSEAIRDVARAALREPRRLPSAIVAASTAVRAAMGTHVPWWSNWALFYALNHASRSRLGMPFDHRLIESALDYVESVHDGHGWFDDAERPGTGHFDDYSNWVFAFHYLALRELGFERAGLTAAVRRQMQDFPFFFASDGAYPEFGRSMLYRWARLGAPLMAYRQGLWPHSVGVLKRVVERHYRWYRERGVLSDEGALVQSVTAMGDIRTLDAYSGVGSAYNAMQFFAALWDLPDNDPFWTCEGEPLPVDHGDFRRVIQGPGWLLVGRGGHVDRFNAGSRKSPLKYGKFCYSTRGGNRIAPPDIATGADSMLCLTDGVHVGHRDGIESFSVGDDWLEFEWCQRVGSRRHAIKTRIELTPTGHRRTHRIRPAGPVRSIESSECGLAPGAVALIPEAGYAGPATEIHEVGGHFTAAVSWRSIALANVDGPMELRCRVSWRD